MLDWTDAQLARACRQGSAAAWRQLVRRQTPLAYRLAYRILGNGSDAQDACQEAFMRVHRSFGSYDPTRPLAPWVARITYHVCLRRLQRRGVAVDDAEPQALEAVRDERGPDPEASATQAQAVELLESALAELSAQDRGLLTLRYREGLSDSEVADASGMPINTVKTRIFRARGRLRALLAPLLKEDSHG